MGGKTCGLNSREPHASLDILSPPQHRGNRPDGGHVPDGEHLLPCQLAQLTVGCGGVCSQPHPTGMSAQGTSAECPAAICPALGTSQPPLEVHVALLGTRCWCHLPQGGMGQKGDSGIAGEEKHPPAAAGPALALEENRQQVLTWPRARHPDSARTQSKPEAPWGALMHEPDLRARHSHPGTSSKVALLPRSGAQRPVSTNPAQPRTFRDGAQQAESVAQRPTGTGLAPGLAPAAQGQPQARADTAASNPAHTPPAHW